MGRIDAAQAIADILMPEPLTTQELMKRVADSATVVLGADLLEPERISTFSSSTPVVAGEKIEGPVQTFEAPWPPETPDKVKATPDLTLAKPKRKKV